MSHVIEQRKENVSPEQPKQLVISDEDFQRAKEIVRALIMALGEAGDLGPGIGEPWAATEINRAATELYGASRDLNLAVVFTFMNALNAAVASLQVGGDTQGVPREILLDALLNAPGLGGG